MSTRTNANGAEADAHAANLDEHFTADFCGVKVKTVQGWRLRGVGPKYFKIGSRVRYRLEDLRAFLATCAVEPAGQEQHATR
jgi:hypothetical protein